MKNRNQRVRQLLEVLISASCEAKYLGIEGAIRPEIERTIDQAAKDVRTHISTSSQQERTSWLKLFGIS